MKKITSAFFKEISYLSDLQKDPQEEGLYYVETRVKDDNDYQQRLWKFSPSTNENTEILSFQKNVSYFFDKEGLWTYSESENEFIFALHGSNTMKKIKLAVEDVRALSDNLWVIEASCYPRGKVEEDVQVYEEVPFLSNGEGIIHGRRHSLFLFDKETESLLPVSEEMVDVNSWTIAHNRILFSGEEFSDIHHYYQHVYEYDLATKKLVRLSEEERIVTQVLYHHGKPHILGSDGRTYGLDEIAELQCLEKGRYTSLYAPHQSAFNGIVTDVSFGKHNSFFTEDNRNYLIATEDAKANLYEISDREYLPLTNIKGSVESAIFYQGKIYFIGLVDQHLSALYCYEDEAKLCVSFNQELEKEYYIAPPQKLHFRFDNPLQGWALLPENYDASRSYPSILAIHGGPQGAYSNVFVHELQYWASEGYIVYFGNPRGSCGKGNEFGSLKEGWGYRDYHDILDIIRQARIDYPNIDPQRMAVTGGSYGGYMTNWIVSHNHNFCCAVSQRSICNWISEAYSSDEGLSILQELPVKDKEVFHQQLWDMSPLKYVNNVKTPTLLIHSDEDYRCSLEEAYQFYTALKYRRVPCKLIVFKGENHDLSRKGKPKNRLRRIEEITSWFYQYCQKK